MMVLEEKVSMGPLSPAIAGVEKVNAGPYSPRQREDQEPI